MYGHTGAIMTSKIMPAVIFKLCPQGTHFHLSLPVFKGV